MSASSPPTGWESSAEWNADWSLDETGGELSPRMLLLGGNSNAVTLYSPWIPLSQIGGDEYSLYVKYKADRTSGGDNVTIQFVAYQDDRETVAGTYTLYAAAVAPSTGWEVAGANVTLSAGGKAWGRFKVTKAATDFNLRIDQVRCARVVPNAQLYRSTGGSWSYLTASGWDTVPYDLVIEDELMTTDVSGSPAAGTVTVIYPDVYIITATVCVDGMDSGELAGMRIRVDAGGVGSYTYYQGNHVYASANGQDWCINAVFVVPLETDDIVDIQFYSDANQTILGGSDATKFAISSVRGVN